MELGVRGHFKKGAMRWLFRPFKSNCSLWFERLRGVCKGILLQQLPAFFDVGRPHWLPQAGDRSLPHPTPWLLTLISSLSSRMGPHISWLFAWHSLCFPFINEELFQTVKCHLYLRCRLNLCTAYTHGLCHCQHLYLCSPMQHAVTFLGKCSSGCRISEWSVVMM